MPLQASDRAAFADMLAAVAGIYGRDLTEQTLAIYWGALAAYDLAAVRQALDRHVKNPDAGQFMPKPADLIRMLGGTTVDGAMRAWAQVERAIRLVGGWSDVVFDDPLIHRVIDDLGGWAKLCETKTEELPFRARDFQALYRGFAMRRERPPYPPLLMGRANTQNASQGLALEAPVCVGDPGACLQVQQQRLGVA